MRSPEEVCQELFDKRVMFAPLFVKAGMAEALRFAIGQVTPVHVTEQALIVTLTARLEEIDNAE